MKRTGVIFDIDGTLCDVSEIRHYVLAAMLPDGTYKTKNFDAFQSEAINCPPIPWVLEELRAWEREGVDILVVTARSERYARQLDWWLAENEIYPAVVKMRPDKDYRKDYTVKSEILEVLQKRWYILRAYDDNPHVIALWEEHGIPTTHVPGWVE